VTIKTTNDLPFYVVSARLKPLQTEPATYRLVCGGESCPATLGTLHDRHRADIYTEVWGAAQVEFEVGGVWPGEWIGIAPDEFPGYRRLDDGSFVVVKGKKSRDALGNFRRSRMGRRPVPLSLDASRNGIGTYDVEKGIRGIAGRYPSPPAVIACPTCKRRNLVLPPDST
jgi:hypothetical protein